MAQTEAREQVRTGIPVIDRVLNVETHRAPLAEGRLAGGGQKGAGPSFATRTGPFTRVVADQRRTFRFPAALFRSLRSREVTLRATQQTRPLIELKASARVITVSFSRSPRRRP